jgi:hypothetical protein
MKTPMNKPTSVEHFRYASSFENLRKTLSNGQYADDQEKSLAYWVVPSDRRLPQAFLGRKLSDVLDTPFDDLASTPGVGQKKMKSLLKLLTRIAQRQPAAPDPAALDAPERRNGSRRQRGQNGHQDGFEVGTVSEETWRQWAKAILASGMAQEQIGKLAPSLQSLPTVIWQTSLDWYLDRSLSEIRRLKTHGEKRVRVVLEVMHGVYEVVSKLQTASHLTVRLMPIAIAAIERWIQEAIAAPKTVATQGVRDALLVPLVQQIGVDCGPMVARVVENRLPIRSTPVTVHGLSRKMAVTRARIYQLLEEAEHAIDLRWPEGRCYLTMLTERVAVAQPDSEVLAALQTTLNVFYPDMIETARRAEDSKAVG